MNVLKPTLVYIDGRCYRKLPFEQQVRQTESRQVYQDCNDGDDETCDGLNLVETTSNGYRLSVDIPSALFGSIIGYKGETKKRIEQDTGTSISIPRKGAEGPIVITGSQKSGILSASNRIEVVAEAAREKKPYTHFLSLPLYNDKLVGRFEEFKNSVLNECSQCSGIEPSIFQVPSKLHLTIGMLRLLDKAEVNKAADFLSSCYREIVSEILGSSPVEVKLSGVEYMNDDPSQVDVLYMKVQSVDGSDRLQRLADTLVDRFETAGLTKKEYEHVKLHATVMNSNAAMPTNKGKTNGGPSKWSKRVSFDARDILKMFEDFDFGTYHLHSIHLSQRGEYDKDGHYICAASAPLP